jgi:hypothetical protein
VVPLSRRARNLEQRLYCIAAVPVATMPPQYAGLLSPPWLEAHKPLPFERVAVLLSYIPFWTTRVDCLGTSIKNIIS